MRTRQDACVAVRPRPMERRHNSARLSDRPGVFNGQAARKEYWELVNNRDLRSLPVARVASSTGLWIGMPAARLRARASPKLVTPSMPAMLRQRFHTPHARQRIGSVLHRATPATVADSANTNEAGGIGGHPRYSHRATQKLCRHVPAKYFFRNNYTRRRPDAESPIRSCGKYPTDCRQEIRAVCPAVPPDCDPRTCAHIGTRWSDWGPATPATTARAA